MSETVITLGQLASQYDCKIHGDSSVVIADVATLSSATNSSLTFLANSKYKSVLKETKAAAVVLTQNDLKFCPTNALVTNEPYLLFAQIASHFDTTKEFNPEIHTLATIHPSSQVPSTCGIESGVVIAKNVVLGEHVFRRNNRKTLLMS